MFKKVLGLLTGAFLLALPLQAQAAGTGKPIVAVYEMHDLTNGGLADTMSTMIATAVAATNKFRVIERNELDKVLAEQTRAKSGLLTTNAPGKIGGFEGADYLIYGTITSLSVVNKSDFGSTFTANLFTPQGSSPKSCVVSFATVSLDIKITDASTGEIRYVTRIDEQQKSAPACDGQPQVDSSSLLRSAADKVATSLVTAIYPIQVAAVQADGVFILNYGEGAVKSGDILGVYTKGEEIKDPATGEVIANTEEKLGFIRVTDVTGRVSKAVAASDFTAAPQVGSIARPASAEDLAALKAKKKR